MDLSLYFQVMRKQKSHFSKCRFTCPTIKAFLSIQSRSLNHVALNSATFGLVELSQWHNNKWHIHLEVVPPQVTHASTQIKWLNVCVSSLLRNHQSERPAAWYYLSLTKQIAFILLVHESLRGLEEKCKPNNELSRLVIMSKIIFVLWFCSEIEFFDVFYSVCA